MSANSDKPPSSGWAEAVPWMGCPTQVLVGWALRHRLRIDFSRWPGFLFDLGFSAFNSGLALVHDAAGLKTPKNATFESPPLFILGHWRTGTTWLHELLALDSRHRAPTTFECFLPGHFYLTQAWLKWWTGFLLPPNRPPDNMQMGWDLPQEDEFALALLGHPSVYEWIAFPQDSIVWEGALDIDSLPPEQQARWKRDWMSFLKRLIALRPGRLILKSPQHTCRIPTILELFPDARFVYLVRNPASVIPSTIRLWTTMFAAYGYQTPKLDALEDTVFAMFRHYHERLEATRGLVPAGNFVELRYEDLVADPLAQLDRLYHQLDLGDLEPVRETLAADIARRANYRPNKHQVPEELAARIATECRAYCEQYGYESGAGERANRPAATT